MQHLETNQEDDRDEGILLVEVEQSFWLLDGDAHLSAMLSNEKPYPKPVRCLGLPSMSALGELLPEGVTPGELWAVHPDIVARLKQNDELVAVELAQPN
ncbi:hypothetical protein [Rhizobium sp. GN54]|uniref:hypothetical protein n=1 Tax=Rhizobium sp. GN54 TaxID=2898150 RepID=UPI001E293CBD|nr:hypothetical protein [Rhizobium sp. GN54]MCD2184681.1 hypothetical protein [Rhizobium sp. GN54]